MSMSALSEGLMINKKFGKLTVVSLSEKQGANRNKYYDCICDCGKSHRARADNLKNGNTTECKVCQKAKIITHGMSGSKFYYVYKALKERCEKESHQAYKNYGGRGIKNLWISFEEFKEDMFSSYIEGLELDRVDNDGDYCKENCRWATRSENASNRRISGKVPYRGVIFVHGKYRASVRPPNSDKMICIGHFDTAISAAKAFDEYCIAHNLPKKLNFN